MTRKVDTMISEGERLVGHPYVLGAKASPSNPNPGALDCSGFTSWAAGRAHLTLNGSAWAQYTWCRDHKTLISLHDAFHCKGAVLFIARGSWASGGLGNHVGFSLGNGYSLQARGRRYGIGSWPVGQESWTHAGLIPGGDYFAAPIPPPPVAHPLPMRPSVPFGEVSRNVAIAQWELAVISGAQFPGETGPGDNGTYGLHTAQAVVNLGRVLAKNWDGKWIGPDQWAAIDFLYISKGNPAVLK